MNFFKPLWHVIHFIKAFILPSNYRAVFLGQTKVAIYLTSGQTVYLKCKHWKVTVGKEKSSYSFDQPDINVLFRPSDIVAVREVSWWR